MRIGLFASAFWPHVGGVEELTRQLALELQREGHRVIIVTNCWPRNLPKFERIGGLDVHRVPLRTPGAGIKSEISYRLTRAAIETKVAALVRSFGADVIHVQCVSPGARYAMEASRRTGVPIVVTLQGELTMDATQLFQRSAWARRVMRDALESADAITACSRQTLDEAEAWYGKPFGRRGSVIYNGIAIDDARAEPFAHPRPYVLAIGRHVPQKGFDVLLRAFARLATEPGFDHDLILAGDGPEHEALKRLAGSLATCDRVTFTGRVDHATAMKLFAGCSFFALPSRHEPFGIVNLEAMAAGKAVIATRVGGVPEIVSDRVNGLLVPPEDVEALADATRRIAGDPALRELLGAAGREQAANFIWPNIVEQYMSVYRQVIPTTERPARNSAAAYS
jgi:glycogen(starch) synthase